MVAGLKSEYPAGFVGIRRNAVNRSVFPCLAASRTRPSACVTRARPWVRSVLCRFAFPLVPGLRSTNSAPGCPGLFAGLTTPMPRSDLPRSFIGGCGSSPSRRGPTDHKGRRPARRSPGSRTRNVPTFQGLRPHRARRALAMTRLSVSPSDYSTPSAPGIGNFRGSMSGLWACALPCRRFAPALADRHARHGADAVRYSFIVKDFHHLFLASLPAHWVLLASKFQHK